MKKITLKAYSVTNELDLNKIAVLRGIKKKYVWEEALILQGDTLRDILEVDIVEEEKVFLFSFGSVVFFNINGDKILKIMMFLYENLPEIDLKNFSNYSDDYEIRIYEEGENDQKGNEQKEHAENSEYSEHEEHRLTDEYIVLSSLEDHVPEIVSTVIAKSVALERIEGKMGKIMDSIEHVIEKIERKKLTLSNQRVAKIVSEVVRHEYNTISYIMILDKPDITWTSSDANELYDELAKFFELDERYKTLRSKTEIINSIIDNFASISNSIRGLFVEWVIVLLILVEIIMGLIEMFK